MTAVAKAKPKPPTVDEIAAKYGWKHIPQSVKGEYKFKKGRLVISMSKLGRGSLTVSWRKEPESYTYSIQWPTRIKDGDRELVVYDSTREEYIDLLLRNVTVESFSARVEEKLTASVAKAERDLAEATERLASFRASPPEREQKA